MPIQESPKPYYQKEALDNAIDVFARKDKPTQADLGRVGTIASIQAGLDKYRSATHNMSQKQLIEEKHNSSRMGKYLEASKGKRRPPRCHAHAIVSGGHKYAARLRAILAWFKLRIDDPANACWLPENTKATPHPLFPNAVPHSRIHRAGYYQWLTELITMRTITDLAHLKFELSFIARKLQHGTFPPSVMQPKQRS